MDRGRCYVSHVNAIAELHRYLSQPHRFVYDRLYDNTTRWVLLLLTAIGASLTKPCRELCNTQGQVVTVSTRIRAHLRPD